MITVMKSGIKSNYFEILTYMSPHLWPVEFGDDSDLGERGLEPHLVLRDVDLLLQPRRDQPQRGGVGRGRVQPRVLHRSPKPKITNRSFS